MRRIIMRLLGALLRLIREPFGAVHADLLVISTLLPEILKGPSRNDCINLDLH